MGCQKKSTARWRARVNYCCAQRGDILRRYALDVAFRSSIIVDRISLCVSKWKKGFQNCRLWQMPRTLHDFYDRRGRVCIGMFRLLDECFLLCSRKARIEKTTWNGACHNSDILRIYLMHAKDEWNTCFCLVYHTYINPFHISFVDAKFFAYSASFFI